MTCTKQATCTLPENPNPEYYRKQAKQLYRAFKLHDANATKRFSAFLSSKSINEPAHYNLSDAQTVLAREHGCGNWPAFLDLINNNSYQSFMKTMRKQFADELYSLKKITSQEVRTAFSEVPREEFIGAPPWRFPEFYWYPYLSHLDDKVENIYQDTQVNPKQPIQFSNGIPSAQAKWIEALNPLKGEKVLHIGCDTGYYTAILAQLVGSEGEVHFFDTNLALHDIAKANLSSIKQSCTVQSIVTICKTHSFDIILINAGVRKLKPEWLDALKEGGRILVSMIASYADCPVGYGETLLLCKTKNNYQANFIPPVNHLSGGYFPYLDEHNIMENNLVKAAYSRKGYKSVRSLRLDTHQCDDSCWLHQESYCLSKQAA